MNTVQKKKTERLMSEASKTTRTLLQIMREQAACPTARVRVTAAGAPARPHATCQQVL